MSNTTDVLYAWMLPHYAVVRREKFDWTLQDTATQWEWLVSRVNAHTDSRLAVALDDVTRAGRQEEALAGLDRMWTTVTSKP